MRLPQFLMLGLLFLSLGINMAKHGEPRTDKYDGWTALIALVIMMTLLVWGGFFSV